MSGQPTGSSTQLEKVDIDFRVSGLPHSVVKQAENSRVRELFKKIENHLHRQDLQADLQQNNAYNPFSEKFKKMIKDMGNVELVELCETNPEVQCKESLLCWNQGIVCCTCGHFLKEVPHFAVLQPVVKSTLRCCLLMLATSTPRRKALPKRSSSLSVPS